LTSSTAIEVAQGITQDTGKNTTGGAGARGDIDGYWTSIPANGNTVRNLIHGAEYVMSHITHFYALSALDFINTSAYPGMSPWLPTYTVSDMLDGSTGTGKSLVLSYVTALDMRRRAAALGAMFGGRKPIQNAIVPGGVTTLMSSTYPITPVATDYDKFGPYKLATTVNNYQTELNKIRNFINTTYIPDVLTVAGAYTKYWYSGTADTYLLSYGDFVTDTAGTLAIKRGILTTGAGTVAFDQANIQEYAKYSHYQYTPLVETGLHPFSGRTDPYVDATSYSWLKAPRYNDSGTVRVCEVGPLARIAVTHYFGGSPTVSQAGTGVTALTLGALGATYNVNNLVTEALGALGIGATNLWSTLGRHACRALEAKYVADAIYAWSGTLTANQPAYTYKKLSRQLSSGYGLREAHRGALGHWITIDGKKIAKYQCVVPTTWNASPKDDSDQRGAAEQALMGTRLGITQGDWVVNILRTLHPFDFCIACAVHVVGADGKELLKFAVGPDGKIKIEE